MPDHKPHHKPRRSVLYMPGANARALEKARTLAADCLIFDLEDAVAPEAKAEARAQIAAALEAGSYAPREVIIRINGLDTPWGMEDMRAACAAAPDAILVPKIMSDKDIARADALMPDMIALWAMVETPLALLNMQDIAAQAHTSKLTGLVMGTNDLLKDMHAPQQKGRAALQTALAWAVLAARAYGLCIIDGVFNDIADEQGLREETQQGQHFGFDGKTLIHPNQIETANDIFAPTADEIIRAQAIIDAFALPENAGKGVIKVNGTMTELLHLARARQTLAIAGAIKAAKADMP